MRVSSGERVKRERERKRGSRRGQTTGKQERRVTGSGARVRPPERGSDLVVRSRVPVRGLPMDRPAVAALFAETHRDGDNATVGGSRDPFAYVDERETN